MRNFLRFGFVLLFLFWWFDGVGQTIDPDYIDGEFYIKLKKVDTKSFSKTSSAVNFQKELPFLSNLISSISVASAERSFYFSNSELLQSVYRIKIDNPKKGFDFMNSVEQDDNVEYIERVPLKKNNYNPNDIWISNQYSLNITRTKDAWDVSKGIYEVKIAIIDDAVQTDHPDLAENIYLGYDATNGTFDARPPNKNVKHGTHVAGIAGSVTDNTIGIASIGFNKIKIIAVKAGNSTGQLTHTTEGIVWASQLSTNIINMSFGGASCITEQNAINEAHNLGKILVAAAGNKNSSGYEYPAAYNHVISVANTNFQDKRYDDPVEGSNYGTWIDISAPGTGIYSSIPTVGFNWFENMTGTSMSSPMVASLCGYILSHNPSLSTEDVEAILKGSSDNIDYLNPGYSGKLGAGRINTLNAVNYKYIRYNVQDNMLCSGSTVTMGFMKYGNFNSNNNFNFQFAPINSTSYTNLATSTTTNSISAVLPYYISPGYYKVRIISTSPYIETTNTVVYINGTVGGVPTGSQITSSLYLSASSTTLYNATSTCIGNSISLYESTAGYDVYWWTKDGLNYTASSTSGSYLSATQTGTYTLNMTKCNNVYKSSNSIYLKFYDALPTYITASSNGQATDYRLTTCEGSPVTLTTNCDSGVNPIWSDGSTSPVRYINASSTRDFRVNCNNSFCNVGYSYPVRITALNPNVQSTKTGNWQDATLWTSSLVPLNCQTVTIQTGHTVNVPINDAKAKNIIIRGRLNFQIVSPTVKGKVGLGI